MEKWKNFVENPENFVDKGSNTSQVAGSKKVIPGWNDLYFSLEASKFNTQ